MPVSIDITEGEIRNAIAVALSEAFTDEKRDAMMRDVIRAHLQIKSDRYAKETLLSKTVGNMIRQTAEEEMRRIVDDEMQPSIKAIVQETMGEPFKEAVYLAVRKALVRITVSNLKVDFVLIEEEDDE